MYRFAYTWEQHLEQPAPGHQWQRNSQGQILAGLQSVQEELTLLSRRKNQSLPHWLLNSSLKPSLIIQVYVGSPFSWPTADYLLIQITNLYMLFYDFTIPCPIFLSPVHASQQLALCSRRVWAQVIIGPLWTKKLLLKMHRSTAEFKHQNTFQLL